MAVTPLYIDDLAAKTTLSDGDLVIVGEGDDAKKMTIAQLKEQLGINALNTKIQDVFSAVRNDADYNTITDPGWYNCTSSLHAPFAGEWTLMLVLSYPGNTVAQIAFSVSSWATAVRVGNMAEWHTQN